MVLVAHPCFVTNDNTLPAYQIVLLYKHRWDIEKIFHQFKSKMGERKFWATLDAKQSMSLVAMARKWRGR